MTNSISISILWLLAEREASSGGFETILPKHFWIALCKAVDLDISAFLKNADEKLRHCTPIILGELDTVRQVLAEASIPSQRFRRNLRASLGRGEHSNGQLPLHRSQDVRTAFRRAGRLVQDDASDLLPIHLCYGLISLSDPTLNEALESCGSNGPRLKEAINQQLVRFVAIDPGVGAGAPAIPQADVSPGKPQKPKKSVLLQFGRDLSQLAKDGKLLSLIGRKAEILQVAQVLLQARKNNAILVGEPGVGKTGIVEGLAQRIADGKVPEGLSGLRIIDLSLAMLIAGTNYRGQFEERMQAVIREATADPKVVLFLDEIHTLMGAGQVSGGAMDAANILKPALARGEIKVIGATTTAEYRLHIEKDAALERRFQRVQVEEPSRDEALEILRGIRPKLAQQHGIWIADDALIAAVDWSIRYLPDLRLPDKAIDLVDTACAQARFMSLSRQVGKVGGEAVTRDQIAAAVAQRCKIPVGTLTAEDGERLRGMEEALSLRVKGQQAAIRTVCEAVQLARAGLKNPNRPVGSFLFVGSSGTGKTELAKALAEFLFHTEQALIRLDMSEFMEENSVSKLIGAPPGYKGYDEEGQLTGKIRSQPYSVVLFDEVEKAHPKVMDVFLQMFDEGTLTDSKGRKCSFRDAVIILTSNLGAQQIKADRKLGFGAQLAPASDGKAQFAEQIQAAIKQHMRPELINRLSGIVQFQYLQPENIREIVDKSIGLFNQRMADRNVIVTLAPDAYEILMAQGYSLEYGAREMERTIERLIAKPLAGMLLAGEIANGSRIKCAGNKGSIQLNKE
jgi:ATP-dependent Clp protease ATP-binding subunit ClpC